MFLTGVAVGAIVMLLVIILWQWVLPWEAQPPVRAASAPPDIEMRTDPDPVVQTQLRLDQAVELISKGYRLAQPGLPLTAEAFRRGLTNEEVAVEYLTSGCFIISSLT